MLKKYLKIELKDDNTETGGIAFVGETVGDFIDHNVETIENITLEELNTSLILCGIKPIKEI